MEKLDLHLPNSKEEISRIQSTQKKVAFAQAKES